MEKQLLQESIRYINVILDKNGKKLEINRSRLLSLDNTRATQGEHEEFMSKVREERFNKIKQRQVNKFNRLVNKTGNKDRETSASSSNYSYQLQTSRSQSNQTIISNSNNKWVVNLSKTTLTPAQYSLLGKGPQLCWLPLKSPHNVDYISAIESISHKLMEQDVQELKSDVNSLLKRVPTPKANLTKEERKA